VVVEGSDSVHVDPSEAMSPATKMYFVHPHATAVIQKHLSQMKAGKLFPVEERFPSSTFIQVLRNTSGR